MSSRPGRDTRPWPTPVSRLRIEERRDLGGGALSQPECRDGERDRQSRRGDAAPGPQPLRPERLGNEPARSGRQHRPEHRSGPFGADGVRSDDSIRAPVADHPTVADDDPVHPSRHLAVVRHDHERRPGIGQLHEQVDDLHLTTRVEVARGASASRMRVGRATARAIANRCSGSHRPTMSERRHRGDAPARPLRGHGRQVRRSKPRATLSSGDPRSRSRER